MIETEQRHGLKRRWGLPLGVAAIVSATGVVVAVALSGGGTKVADGARPGASGGVAAVPDAPSSATTPDRPATTLSQPPVDVCKLAGAAKEGTAPPVVVGPTPPPVDPRLCAGRVPGGPGGQPGVEPTNPEMHAEPLNPLPAARAAAILTSCAPSGGPWQVVLAVNTAIPTANEDATVIGVNARHEYVFCNGRGDVGTSTAEPAATTMSKIQTGNGHLKEFDSGTDFSDRKNYLMINWGLAGPEVARVTVSYGTEKREAPALLAGGAYLLTTWTPYNAQYTHPPIGYVHAYAADGTKLYDTPLTLAK